MEVATVEIEQKSRKLADTLIRANSVLRPEIIFEISLGRRLIGEKALYRGEVAYVSVDPAEMTEVVDEYNDRIRQNIQRQMLQTGEVSVSMFTCPNGDASRMSEDPEICIPDTFDSDQILYQRLRILFWLFDTFRSEGVPLNLSLLLGDTDFLTYYSVVLEQKGVEIDLEQYLGRAARYRDDIVRFLSANSGMLGNLMDVWSYGDDQIELQDITGVDRNGLSIISMALNTGLWECSIDDALELDAGDIEEEFFYTQRRMNNPNRFDPIIFSGCPDELIRRVARAKFGCYLAQGQYLSSGGGLVLMDELPPQLKCRMLSAGSKELLYLFPWIREEDDSRNPDTVPGGLRYPEIEEMRTQQSQFKARLG